jgi:hypothetical protein
MGKIILFKLKSGMDLSGSYLPEPEFLNVVGAQDSIPGLLKVCKIEFVNLLRRSGIDSWAP